jgi:hypothetical protein
MRLLNLSLPLFVAAVFVGCRSGTLDHSDIVDALTYAKATKADVIREYGQPVRSFTEGKRDVLVFTPFARITSNVSTRTINGVESKVETFVSVPGRKEVAIYLEQGAVVGGRIRDIYLTDLVDRKPTRQEIIREFGKPTSAVARGDREVITFIPAAKITRVVVTKTVNGVESKDETIDPTPGKLKVIVTLEKGVVVEAAVK